MIDADQIRAARALLNWKLSDLARVTGITVNGISLIERGQVQGRGKSLEAFQKAFEDAGVEFTPGSGVRKKDRIIETYDGDGANRRLTEDLYNTLEKTGGEILVAHVDEGDSVKNLELSWLGEQIRKRKAAGISQRLLVRADDPNLIPPLDSYRCIPAEFFSPYPLYIYGSKLALVSWEPSPRVIVVDDERFADSARKLFNFIWKHAAEVSSRKAKKT